jgi:hypothetical protein
MGIKGWTSPSTSVRKSFDMHASVVGPVGGHPDNREVHSKNTVRYNPNETTGQQPAEIRRDVVSGDSPISHHASIATPHKETVGWMDGQFYKPTHPNSARRAAGNAVRTHRPLRPAGMDWDKTGGEFGTPQQRPASGNHGATPVNRAAQAEARAKLAKREPVETGHLNVPRAHAAEREAATRPNAVTGKRK